MLPCVAVLLCGLAISANAQSLLSATYGSGAARVDVSERLRDLSQGGSLSIRVNNQTMGVDPAPGRSKDLHIQVREREGRVREYTFREGEFTNLQLDARADGGRGYRDDDDRRDRDRDGDRRDRDGLVIVRAFWGINNATAEVTGHLQDLVRDNSLYIRVNNETVGVDPAHEHGKVLCVFYRYRGEQRAAIVRETEELKIP
jgi:hypothetical protein